MIEGPRCTGISTIAFFAGLVAGVGTGLLLASQSGTRTRHQLHSFAKDVQDDACLMLGNAKRSIDKVVKQGKSFAG